MKHGLVVILTVVLAGSVGESSGEERAAGREPLEGKRRVAPIRGRRLSPAARAERRDRDAAAEWKREREDRSEREERHRGDKDDADDE